jgi:N6-L-threonylcarbamoyladenine synthase
LFDKIKKAAAQTGIKHIAIAGGVSANSEIRSVLKSCDKKFGWTTYIPKFEYTTDNAAMIAIVGYLKFLENNFSNKNTTATARLSVSES